MIGFTAGRSYLYPVLYHAGLYVQNEIYEMNGKPFSIVLDRDGLWALDFEFDADIELQFRVAFTAKAFITGAGGLPLPIPSTGD